MKDTITIQDKEIDMSQVGIINFEHTRLPKEFAELTLTMLDKKSYTKFHAESPEDIQKLIDAKNQLSDYACKNPIKQE